MLASLPEWERQEIFKSLSDDQFERFRYDWEFWARPQQIAPQGNWVVWLILAGRGFGKTRTGAEWIRGEVEAGRRGRLALVAPTAADARDVMVEGESGILAKSPPWNRPKYEPSKRRLTWEKNGAVATLYSADEPERLRGPQHDGFWADELCSWRYPDTWDMLMFGLRLGKDPRGVVTTTPKPIKLLKELVADNTTHITRGSTFANLVNLAPTFIRKIVAKYEGTRLGRQELDAQILDDLPGALWRLAQIEILRVKNYPPLVRIVVGVDPEASSEEGSAETGIIVVGIDRAGHLYVLFDASIQGTPNEWGMAVVAAYMLYKADCIVVEVNNGGDMCEATIRQVRDRNDQPIGKNLPIKKVHASRGKATRAEPISSIYEQGRAHHVGTFGMLESQMCSWVPGLTEDSPDRMDALVWACTELTVGVERKPTKQHNYMYADDDRDGEQYN